MWGFESSIPSHTARSSSGPGRRPLKAEITGSNPVRATTHTQTLAFARVCFLLFCARISPVRRTLRHLQRHFVRTRVERVDRRVTVDARAIDLEAKGGP